MWVFKQWVWIDMFLHWKTYKYDHEWIYVGSSHQSVQILPPVLVYVWEEINFLPFLRKLPQSF